MMRAAGSGSAVESSGSARTNDRWVVELRAGTAAWRRGWRDYRHLGRAGPANRLGGPSTRHGARGAPPHGRVTAACPEPACTAT